MKVAIIGLGYVGLPLALRFAECGCEVFGLDIDQRKINLLRDGKSYIKHIEEKRIQEFTESKALQISTDFSLVNQADGILICVPTPLKEDRIPDLSYVLETGKSIAPHLKEGTVVILESTTYPGTTDEELRDILEKGSGKKAGKDFFLAFSPEREDPANPESKTGKVPKVVGGYTPQCLEKALEIYSKAIEKLIPVSNCRAAEATKLLENIFRSVNIALVNELKVIYEAMGIDIWEVIEAAKSKPFGFMPFYPGPGLGGHCIPIDPFYLSWKAKEYGQPTRFIELAGEINRSMPDYVIGKLENALQSQGKKISGSKILVVGLAYKPNVDDERESPSYFLMDLLKQKGAEVSYFDPYIGKIGKTREHPAWEGTSSIQWNEETLKKFDAAIIATAHKDVPHKELIQWIPCIVDTRNCLPPDNRVTKA